MRKYSTRQDIRMSQLEANKSHINNGIGAQKVGLILSMSDVKYSGSYWANFSGKSSKCAVLVDNDTDFSFSVAHTALRYS